MIIPCAIAVSAADREGSVDDDAQSAKSTPIKSKPTGAPHSHVLHYGGRGYALRKPATLYVLACALRPLHTWYPIQMESFDSRWERHQRRGQARDNDEAASKSAGGSRARPQGGNGLCFYFFPTGPGVADPFWRFSVKPGGPPAQPRSAPP